MSVSKAYWPDFTFPPLNLLNIPKHRVILDYISNYYYENLYDLWETKDTKEQFKEHILSGRIEINLQVMYKQKMG